MKKSSQTIALCVMFAFALAGNYDVGGQGFFLILR